MPFPLLATVSISRLGLPVSVAIEMFLMLGLFELFRESGGFVSVPVVLAGRMLKIPIAIHESDYTPGLANKIAMPLASKIFTTFQETEKDLPKEKAMYQLADRGREKI